MTAKLREQRNIEWRREEIPSKPKSSLADLLGFGPFSLFFFLIYFWKIIYFVFYSFYYIRERESESTWVYKIFVIFGQTLTKLNFLFSFLLFLFRMEVEYSSGVRIFHENGSLFIYFKCRQFSNGAITHLILKFYLISQKTLYFTTGKF